MAVVFLLAALAGLYASRRRPDLTAIVAPPALLLCLVAGLALPDIDQPLPLDHRSLVTHSIAPALPALLRRWAHPAAAGLALGVGLHLAADLFPNAMLGFATVKMPFAGSIGTELSYLWLGANALAGSWLGGRLLQAHVPHAGSRLMVLAAVAAIGIAYLLSVDGGWPALTIYLIAGWLLLRRRAGGARSAA